MKKYTVIMLALLVLCFVSCDVQTQPPIGETIYTDAPVTLPPETEAPETIPPETMPMETEAPETEPRATEPEVTEPASTDPEIIVPTVEIYTNNNEPILTKTDYVEGVMLIDGVGYEMKIRGRGNASWTTFPKKGYRIKLNSGEPLFGLPKDKDWVLVSSYPDKTLIRNSVAHSIAAVLDGLEYTPTHTLVNFYLNGEYMGIYTIADKIEEDKNKLDFSPKEGDIPSPFGGLDIGFLCEIGWDFDGENVYNKDYFDAEKVVRIYVKEPEITEANTPELTYTREYIYAMERAIIWDADWQDYIDVDSWVDWFIVTELTFNTESAFYRSCYLWKRQGGKLMLGPVWDFDMAFGNHMGDIPGYDGWCTTESSYKYIMENWMNYLLTYEEFTDAIKARWDEKKDELLRVALSAVDEYSEALDGYWQQNFEKWNILKSYVGVGSVNPYVYDTYEKQVQYLRDFISTRWEYMDERITNGDMTPNRPVVIVPDETESEAEETDVIDSEPAETVDIETEPTE